MKERVLVTGASGFVGKVVCRRLIESGYTPRAGLQDAKQWPTLQAAAPGLTEFAILGDLGANPDLRPAFADVSAVVHLAARVHLVRDGAPDPLKEYRRTNVDGTKEVALAAVEQGIRRMILVSTAKVNGESTCGNRFSEDDRPNPQDPYAISKWEAEEVLRSVAASTGLEVVIVRPPLVYGPEVRANFYNLVKFVNRGIPVPLPDTNNRRSLLGVENLADFLVRCISHPRAANQTFMVSDGEDVSTRELVGRLARALGRPARFLPVPALALRLAAKLIRKEPALSRLLGSLAVDSGKARQTLGWTPPFTLDEGLAATAQWYLNRLIQRA
jgi:nucleoside-diphosphate-sugar epimerase